MKYMLILLSIKPIKKAMPMQKLLLLNLASMNAAFVQNLHWKFSTIPGHITLFIVF